jgi:four helix bundle protein
MLTQAIQRDAISAMRPPQTNETAGVSKPCNVARILLGPADMAKRFEDLAAWRFCTELCQRVEELTDAVGDRKFRAQIRDAAASAPALIAEGFARFTTGEMIRYLRMARGELAEVQNHIRKGLRTKYFSASDGESLAKMAGRAMGTTTNFLKAKLRQAEEEERNKKLRRRHRPEPQADDA